MPPPRRFAGQPPRALRAQVVRPAKLPASGQNGIYRKNDTQLFDADHLATIDGLTRFNARKNPRLSRICGVLFSLGHGVVVVAIALVVSLLARKWQTPEWLEAFGAWTSIGFLAALGLLNIHAVIQAHPAELVRPIGLKGRFLGRLAHAATPGLVALVGALFALSFDTIS